MNKRKTVLFVFYFLLAVISYFVNSQEIRVLLLATIIYSATFIKGINQFLVYMCVGVVLHTGSPVSTLLVSLPLYLSMSSVRSATHWAFPLIIVIGLAFLSYYFGIDSQFSTMAVFFSSLLIFVQVLDSSVTPEEFFDYTVLATAIIVTILFLDALNGNLNLRFGRLAINDNIRDLADLVSIPAFLSWSLLFVGNKRKALLLIIGIVSSFVLLLTVSKGALISTALGVFFVILASGKKTMLKNSLLLLLVVVPILIVVYRYSSTNLEGFHLDRLTEEYNGFSGRTDIWSMYAGALFSNTDTVLFGFGPGDIKRLLYSDMYAHSLFLDMFFSYGVLMSAVWIVVLFLLARSIIKSGVSLALGLLVFTIFLYSTHGVVTAPMFYVLMALSYSLSRNKVPTKAVY